MKRMTLAVAVITCSVALAGCDWEIGGSCQTSGGGSCEVHGKIGGSFAVDPELRSAARAYTGGSPMFDASLVTLDTSGSTMTYPSHGQITVSLIDSTQDITVAARTFDYTKSGSTLVFTNPLVVNSWLAGYSNSTADSATYQLVPFGANMNPGPNTLAVASRYSGTTTASVVKHFSYCPGGTLPTKDKQICGF